MYYLVPIIDPRLPNGFALKFQANSFNFVAILTIAFSH